MFRERKSRNVIWHGKTAKSSTKATSGTDKMAENDDQLNLEDRLDRIENNAEGDHKAIGVLSEELTQLKKEFAEFRETSRKDANLLMWTIDMVRVAELEAARGNQQAAIEADKKAREQLETLKKRLAL